MENGNKQTGGTGLERVYAFIVEFMKENLYALSVREICRGTGLSSTSTVHSHLETLEILGKIEMKRKTTRAIRLVGFEIRKEEKSA